MTAVAHAGDVHQQPNPDLLKQFEQERDAARDEQRAARDQIEAGKTKIREAQEMRETAHQNAVLELCQQGLLPADACP